MDLKLIERFLSAMMPPEGKQSVNIAFDCMRAGPLTAVPTIGTMIGHLQQRLYSGDETLAATAAKDMLTGIMIAWSAENPFLRQCVIETYLEHSAKLRGENIIDYFDKKAGR